MATRKSKSVDTERLDDASITRAIQYLENKGTKKGACEILGITYNTTRLDKLLNTFKERKEAEATRRAEKRGKPATESEISYIISSYLEGGTIDGISSALYRGSTFVRGILDKFHVPIRRSSYSYFSPALIPDAAVRDTFKVGERVYSARYDSLAKIISEFQPGVYSIWLESERWKQFAYQPSYELASLEHLKEYIR